jgi:uncharacterized protein (UPF0261 family)
MKELRDVEKARFKSRAWYARNREIAFLRMSGRRLARVEWFRALKLVWRFVSPSVYGIPTRSVSEGVPYEHTAYPR